jgi:hypothetical protein
MLADGPRVSPPAPTLRLQQPTFQKDGRTRPSRPTLVATRQTLVAQKPTLVAERVAWLSTGVVDDLQKRSVDGKPAGAT